MRLALSIAACLSTLTAAQAQERQTSIADVPIMLEMASQAKINHVYDGPWEFFVGGGVAAFDCNGDRKPDLAFAGGTNPMQLFTNKTDPKSEFSFEKTAIDLKDSELLNVTGLYPIDIDNDGLKDLVLLRVGENIILKGEPNCKFSKANRKFAFDGGRAWSTAFSATFEKDQIFPTLAFGNYVDRSAAGSPWGTCHDNVLARPFSKQNPDYSEPTALSPGYCALSMLFTDWNKSGTPSLRITNDRQYYRGGEEQLWRIDAARPPRLYRKADGWKRVNIWGMGIAEADIDADGYPEYALTSMGDTKLQTLDKEEELSRPTYRDIGFEKGATAHRPYTGDDLKPSTGWHSEFADINNDGLLDLFIAKGNVEQMPDFAKYDPDNLLIGQHDGKFVETGDVAGIAYPTKGRGGAVVDLNMDGMPDLVVVNRKAPASIFINTGAKNRQATTPIPVPMGNWLQIELRQKDTNRDAIGATINIKTGNKTQIRKVQIGGGHASGKIGFNHVGLGVAERAQIRVQWPDGEWSAPYRVFANNFVIIDKGSENAKYWYPE